MSNTALISGPLPPPNPLCNSMLNERYVPCPPYIHTYMRINRSPVSQSQLEKAKKGVVRSVSHECSQNRHLFVLFTHNPDVNKWIFLFPSQPSVNPTGRGRCLLCLGCRFLIVFLYSFLFLARLKDKIQVENERKDVEGG